MRNSTRPDIMTYTPPVKSTNDLNTQRTLYRKPSSFGGRGYFLEDPANGKTALRKVKTFWEKMG
jgi:hypothetical protein